MVFRTLKTGLDRLLVGDRGQVLRVLGWALTRICNISLYYTPVPKGAERWLCVDQSRELFSDTRGRGGTSNLACTRE